MSETTGDATEEFDPQAVDEVFCDTCVLLNYVQSEWEYDRSSVLLEDEDWVIVIGENVEEEFTDVTDRRTRIYPDFLDFLLEQDGEIGEYSPSIDDVQANDFDHINEIQMKLASMDREAALRRVRRYTSRVERKVQKILEEYVDEVVPTMTPLGLGFALAKVVPNEADCNVLEDATGWARDGGSGVVATLDSSDLIDLIEEINDVLIRELDDDIQLIIISPVVFETSCSEAS